MFQKALPVGGYVSAGVYHGLNRTLLTNSDGGVGGVIVPFIGIKAIDVVITALGLA